MPQTCLRHIYLNYILIVMTVNAFYDDIDRSLAAGMNAHITKPLVINKPVGIIAKYAGR